MSSNFGFIGKIKSFWSYMPTDWKQAVEGLYAEPFKKPSTKKRAKAFSLHQNKKGTVVFRMNRKTDPLYLAPDEVNDLLAEWQKLDPDATSTTVWVKLGERNIKCIEHEEFHTKAKDKSQ